MFVIFIAAFIFFIFSRFFPIYKLKWLGIDTFYHLQVAKIIRKQGGLPKTIDNFLIKEDYNYPPFIHILLSFFDGKHDQKLQFITPIFDIVTGILIFICVRELFNESAAVVTLIIYIVTPIVIDNSIVLSPRGIASNFFSLSLLLLILFLVSNCWYFVLLSLLFAALVHLTHRLATQTLWVTYISLSLFLWSAVPFVVLCSALILSIILTRGYYIKSLRGHIQFIQKMVSYSLNPATRNRVSNRLPEPQIFLFNAPIIVAAFALDLNSQVLVEKYFSIVSITILSLSILWIFGEGYRHISLGIVPLGIVSSKLLLDPLGNKLLFIVIFVSFLFYIIKMYRLFTDKTSNGIVDKCFIDCCEYLKIHKKIDDIILCLPFDHTYHVMYFTDGIVLHASGGEGKGLEFNYNLRQKLKDEGVNYLLNKYHPTWLLSVDCLDSLKYPATYTCGSNKVINIDYT
jgi:hypothetical protein